jgi:hypothetical protein
MNLNRKFHRGWAVVTILTVGVLAPACGGSGDEGFVKSVKLNTYIQNEETFASLVVSMNTRGFLFVGLRFPIYDRNRPGVQLGEIAFEPDAESDGNLLFLSVNLTRVFEQDNVDGGKLPNGSPLPVSGLDQQPVLGLQTGGSTRVYAALTDHVAVVGAAIVVNEFDAIGAASPVPINFFPSFKLGDKVTGIAGIFTGPEPRTSGFGVFLDLSKLLKLQAGGSSVAMSSVFPSDAQQRALDSRVNELRQRVKYVKPL